MVQARDSVKTEEVQTPNVQSWGMQKSCQLTEVLDQPRDAVQELSCKVLAWKSPLTSPPVSVSVDAAVENVGFDF